MAVPVPARCARRPTVGDGLVVPYISVAAGDGRFLLGNVHNAKAVECIVGKLCQVCGEDLTRPAVILAPDSALAKRFTGEPALHPECARYSERVCPMVAGRMLNFRGGHTPPGLPCNVAGCDCGGWAD